MARKPQQFTIYDMMEQNGIFEQNKANASSGPEYEKANFPKMLYHPQGARKITVAAELISTPYGPKEVNEQSEIIHRIVASQEEEAKWLGEGWHTHPAKAIHAAGGDAPPTSSAERIEDLEGQIAAMKAELDAAKQGKIAKKPTQD